MIRYKKSAVVMIFNDRGDLALQLRAKTPGNSFPLHWDFSVGGTIEAGEEPAHCAVREVREELGVDVAVEFVAREHKTYQSWDPSITRDSDMSIFRTQHNGPFAADPQEVARISFFSLEKIEEMMKSGEKFHPALLLIWKKGLIRSAA